MYFSFTFAKTSEINEEARSYMVVNAALRKEFGVKREPQKAVGDALLLKLFEKQSAYDFALKAKKEYEEIGFTMEQKFIYLSKALMINEQM